MHTVAEKKQPWADMQHYTAVKCLGNQLESAA